MATTFFRTVTRRLTRNKLFSLINISGLAVGLTCFILIATYVVSELGYDGFHEKGDRIFRLTSQAGEDGQVSDFATTPTAAYPEFKRVFPEVESGVRIYSTADFSPTVLRHNEEVREEKGFLWADSTFFELFSFEVKQGDRHTMLDRTNSVVLTEQAARRYFGNEDPLGKTLRAGASTDLTVTGVVADVPENSQIKFDFVASFHTLEGWREHIWGSANFYTYLLLHDPAAAAPLEAKIKAHTAELMKGEFAAGSYLTYVLQPMREVHLSARAEGGLEPGSDMRYVYIFSAIALLILLAACINYINLTTAQAVERAAETGIRKVVGAFNGQLVRQFIGESAFVTAIALVLAVTASYLLLPAFNDLSGRELSLVFSQSPNALLGLVGLGLVVSLVAGGYPAFVLANFQPAKVLKGDFKSTGSGGSLRKTLVVFQFAVSFLLLIGTFVINRQMAFIQNRKLGYDKEQVVVLPMDRVVRGNLSSVKNELKADVRIQQVAAASETPTFVQGGYSIWAEGRPEDFRMTVNAVGTDEDFVKTLGIRLLAGEDFAGTDVAQLATDSVELRRYRFIINESAARELGWTAETAIGKRIRINGRDGTVKAVAEDFHIAPLHQNIAPLALFITDREVNKLMIKFRGGDIPATLANIEKVWKKVAPHRPFNYAFLDQEFDEMYRTEQRSGSIASVFALLAIFIACTGLFGLATYTIQQRRKEIGIRKVLGASVTSITSLLAKDFLKLVAIAFVIAAPVAYFFMQKWLSDFAYRIDIQWWMFVVAGAAAVGIAFLTVSFQSIKAALANPVKSLRSE
ncbi:MAG: ABC transporter permease [Saprospiraceae bacterium]